MAKEDKLAQKKSRRERKKLKVKPPTKIVIRHLPPSMTEEEFLKQIDPLPEHDFYYFSAADWSLGHDATCRAYITLKNYEDVFLFRNRFDGYVFVDNKGSEYAAIVEFAPFQGFAKNKSRNSDNKVNTIEQEPHYEQFLKKLEEDREAATKGGETKLEFSLDMKKEEITSTPLLQYLAGKKEKRREESKKRTAEKKKRREEEKGKQNQEPFIAPAQAVKAGATEDNASKADVLEAKLESSKEEPKNARARRREERNRLRHEAYLQRKKAFKEGKETDNSVGGKEENKSNHKAVTKSPETVAETTTPSPTDKQKPIEILKKTKPVDMLSDSVRDFIFSAATYLTGAQPNGDKLVPEVKENVMDKTSSSAVDNLPKMLSDLQLKSDEVDTPRQTAGPVEQHLKCELTSGLIRGTKKGKTAKQVLEVDEETQEEKDKREERRIRNKDRPSIAIYQPKPRLRLSEESDSNSTSTKDVRSLSVSDCETAAKKEETPKQKKVQRYSERSKSRRKSQSKDVGADEDLKAA